MQFTRDYISPSSLNSTGMCGEAFYLHYICGIETPSDLGKAIGGAIHKTQESCLYYMFNHFGTYPEVEYIRSLALTELNKHIQKYGIKFTKEERKNGEKNTIMRAELLIAEMAEYWLKQVLPNLNPINKDHVEKKFLLSIPGCKLKLKGIMDVVEEKRIRDMKSGGTSDISQSDQYVAYSWWFETHFGFMPECVEDQIKKPDKRTKKITQKSFNYKTVTHTFHKDHFHVLRKKLQLFERYVEQEIFMPSTTYGWWCDEKCGFFEDCRYKYKPKQFAVTK